MLAMPAIPAWHLNFKHPRMNSASDAITCGRVIKRAITTHGQPDFEDPEPKYREYIKDCHDTLDKLHEKGFCVHDIVAKRRPAIELVYDFLMEMETNKLQAISAVCLYREHIYNCSFVELVMIVGPVKAEWFGRALKQMEGDPTMLHRKDFEVPLCGECGSSMKENRKVKPQDVSDHQNSGVGKADDSGEKPEAAAGKKEEEAGEAIDKEDLEGEMVSNMRSMAKMKLD